MSNNIRLVLSVLIIFTSFSGVIYGSTNDSVNIKKLENEITSLKKKISTHEKDIDKIKLNKEYIIENYQIQNTTVLYVSTILGILLTIVIVYFGWRAQRVENEYERAKNDRIRVNDQFDTFFKELSAKKAELNNLVKQINDTKSEIETQKGNLSKLIEDFILTYTKEYIESNKTDLFKSSENGNKAEEIITTDQFSKITEQIELLEKLQHESTPEFDYKKVDVYFKAQKFNKVKTLIEELLEKDNFKSDYYFHYAFSLSEIGNDEKALIYYNKYLESNPKSAAALNNIGVIFKAKNNLEKAIDYYRKALNEKIEFLYFRNLFSCYSETSDRINLFKEFREKFEELNEENDEIKKYKAYYLKFIEDNLIIDALFNYHNEEHQKDDNVSTFLNLLEASILSREESTYCELIGKKDSYKFNSSYKLILNLLIALNNCVKNLDCTGELNNIEIISQDKSSFTGSWRFNLIDGLLEKLPSSDEKNKLISIIEKLKTNKQ